MQTDNKGQRHQRTPTQPVSVWLITCSFQVYVLCWVKTNPLLSKPLNGSGMSALAPVQLELVNTLTKRTLVLPLHQQVPRIDPKSLGSTQSLEPLGSPQVQVVEEPEVDVGATATPGPGTKAVKTVGGRGIRGPAQCTRATRCSAFARPRPFLLDPRNNVCGMRVHLY